MNRMSIVVNYLKKYVVPCLRPSEQAILRTVIDYTVDKGYEEVYMPYREWEEGAETGKTVVEGNVVIKGLREGGCGVTARTVIVATELLKKATIINTRTDHGKTYYSINEGMDLATVILYLRGCGSIPAKKRLKDVKIAELAGW